MFVKNQLSKEVNLMKKTLLIILIVACIGVATTISGIATAYTKTNNEGMLEAESGGLMIVNLNTASKDELIMVSGIGPTLAERVIQFRAENGPFENAEDVMLVKGIGEAKFKKIQSMITI